ncbi:MAG: CoA transferase [Actinomycetia bacterium]|nr:CoA transferase [Actinomycetes bacterium]
MKPLEGLRVLDMSRVLAGPFAGRMLSDLGADVVKVEPPEGDVTRNWGKVRSGQAGYYVQQNVGKRNICVDLGVEGGPDLIERLVPEVDVLIENYRPGIMKRFGLDWESLQAINPKLVMLSISGFGQDGPDSQRAAYAPILHAESGWMLRASQASGNAPVDPYLSVADTNSSMHGLIGIFAALRMRDVTGEGQHIDLAMLDAMLVTDDASNLALDGARYRPNGGIVWDGIDGPVLTSGEIKWIWHQLHNQCGVQDPTPESADLETKIACRTRAIQDHLLTFPTRDAMLDELDRANLAWANVNSSPQAYASATAQHRGSSVEIDARDGSTRRVPQSPYRFSNAESGLDEGSRASHRGEHNVEVLAEWVGVSRAEVDTLSEAGVLLAE